MRYSLDDGTIDRAREIGEGNVSGGIRTAVAAYPARMSRPAARRQRKISG